jgi:Skp family chaperone for outer membrane proteins
MRGFVLAVLLAFAADAGLALAQTAAPPAAQTQKPAAPPSAPQQPPPQQPAQAPPAAPAAPAPVPPAPFPQGAKVAYVNLQAVAQLSVEGKAAAARVQQLTQKKQAEIAEKTKALQAQQQKLEASAGVLSEQARIQLERDIERQNRELERLQQDAQAELNELQQTLQEEFQKKLIPILGALSGEKGLHFLFSAADAGLIWAADGLDLTAEAVKRLDAGPAAK